MFVDFNKVFENKDQTQLPIPQALVTYMNSMLPEGVKYIVDQQGKCVIKADGEAIVLEGFYFQPTEEQKNILGDNYSSEDIMKYCYNAQKAIPLKLEKEGYIIINGKEISIDKISFNPMKPVEYISGTFYMKPMGFPKPFKLQIGCKEYTRDIIVSRVPNDSVNINVYESEKEEPLYIKYVIDSKKEEFTISISYNLKYAKSIRDIVESTVIYNAYVNGKGYLCNELLEAKAFNNAPECFDYDSIEFWKKVLKIEEILGVSFIPPDQDVDYETRCIVEQLYQNLINKIPVRGRRVIDSVDGEWKIREEDKFKNSIGEKLYFEFEATNVVDLLGVKFELPVLIGVFNAIMSDYKVNDKKMTIYFADESQDKTRYVSEICFKSKEELDEYKIKEKDKVVILRNAKKVYEYM